MKNNLSIGDLAIWVALIASKVILCTIILKKRLFHLMRWFSAYVFASTAKSLLLLAITFLGSYAAYYYVYYAAGYIVSALAFLTLIECGRRVLPGLNLPQREKAGALLLVAIGGIIAFSGLWPLHFVENRIELGAQLSVAVAFFFIAIYSRYLGLSWSRLLAGIASSLGFLYLVQGTAKAIAWHYPSDLVLQVRQIDAIANVLAIIAWIVVVLSPWGTREFTEQDVLKIEAAFARIEASVGTGEVKTV
jgi:hypothetical protein